MHGDGGDAGDIVDVGADKHVPLDDGHGDDKTAAVPGGKMDKLDSSSDADDASSWKVCSACMETKVAAVDDSGEEAAFAEEKTSCCGHLFQSKEERKVKEFKEGCCQKTMAAMKEPEFWAHIFLGVSVLASLITVAVHYTEAALVYPPVHYFMDAAHIWISLAIGTFLTFLWVSILTIVRKIKTSKSFGEAIAEVFGDNYYSVAMRMFYHIFHWTMVVLLGWYPLLSLYMAIYYPGKLADTEGMGLQEIGASTSHEDVDEGDEEAEDDVLSVQPKKADEPQSKPIKKLGSSAVTLSCFSVVSLLAVLLI